MKVDFEKLNGKWYVVMDDFQGDFEDLEMVDGADIFLDNITTDNMTASIDVLDEKTDDCVTLELVKHDEFGGTYDVLDCDRFKDFVWLCNVAHLFFDGEHPDYIYFKIIE